MLQMLTIMENCLVSFPFNVLLLCLSCVLTSAKEIQMLTLDSRALCSSSSNPPMVHWVSRDKSLIVIGRGADDRQRYRDCSVVIGAASASPSMLRLKFDAFHIENCGVTVEIDQSLVSDFNEGVGVMARVGCNHGKLDTLQSMEKHYVKIAVHRNNINLEQYNFRINVTVVGKLSDTGPQTHVVIIVGITVLIVVVTALWLLVKYLLHRSHRWQEHCAQSNMERAIRLYNNQPTPVESDYMYTALPPLDDCVDHHHAKYGGGRGGRHRTGDITFVHADGHMETFRMSSPQMTRHQQGPNPPLSRHHQGNPAVSRQQGPQISRQRSDTIPAAHSTTAPRLLHIGNNAAPSMAPRNTNHLPANNTDTDRDRARDGGRDRDGGRVRDADSVAESTLQGKEEGSGECPPSYEEALYMPTPHDSRAAVYVNLNSDDNKPVT